jgi:hypothetical protein
MLCDLNQSDTVDYPTFVSAVVALDGVASCIDLHVISVRQLTGFAVVESRHREIKEQYDFLQRQLTHVASQVVLGGVPPPQTPAKASLEPALGMQLSLIEAEIKELKKIATTPLQSRAGSRIDTESVQTPLTSTHMNGVASTPLAGDEDSVAAMSVLSEDGANSMPKQQHFNPLTGMFQTLTKARFESAQPGSNEAALQETVRKLEKSLESAGSMQRQSNEALAKTGIELESLKHRNGQLERLVNQSNGTSDESREALLKTTTELSSLKEKNEQLQRLVKLQDAREAELQRQMLQMKSGHDAEVTRLERSRADLNEQVRHFERRAMQLESDQVGQLRAVPRSNGGGGLFDWNSCGTARAKEPPMR